jgi:hypothetical protein
MARSDDATEAGEQSPKRVLEAGLAVVHEGELVFPAAGSAAQAELMLDDRSSEIAIYFPVEIEIRTVELDSARMRHIAEDVLHDMARTLAAKI